MRRNQRLNQILSAVVAHGSLEVPELAHQFGVSHATIRRDLDVLERQRLVSRTRGGATTHAAFNDLPLSYKTAQDLAEKRRIAYEARRHLAGARVIGMTGGTTVTEFARLLSEHEGVTVVTNALNVALHLVENPRLRVFAAGGEIRSSSQETVGHSTEAFLAEYNLDVAFVGVDGVDADAGCTNYDPAGARANGVLAQRARRVIVLADATKIGRVALARVCGMVEADLLITDDRAPADQVDRIKASGCDVTLV
ncbi:MAG TPA: DeoR/GlpR family DNA-binding transcription regulator [Pseudonocardiaceae bacterium]|jgi:DeoR family transcriptional regulator of aga operon|nr:DeoR/GlpR family DNA-binding transcription regulator [Pseudonocardiaceae bacterium]